MSVNYTNDMGEALKSCKRFFFTVGVFSMFINFLMLAPSFYMLQVYDRVITSRSVETLLMLTLIIVFLFLVMGGLEVVRSLLLVRASNNFDKIISERIYNAMFRQGVAASQTAQPLSDLNNVRQFISSGNLFAFFDAPWIPFYIAVLFFFNFWFGLFSAIAGLVLIGVAVGNEYFTRRILVASNDAYFKAQKTSNSNLKNAEVLHAMGMLPSIRARWKEHHLDYLINFSKSSDRSGVLSNISKVARSLFQSLILALGALLVINEDLSPGMMIAGSILMGRALAPIDQMIGVWKNFIGVRGAYVRLKKLLIEIPEDQVRMSLPEPAGHLSIENVTIIPAGTQIVTLRGISFNVAKGEHIGIIGQSASGKSTLARALLGIWPTTSGNIRLDGADITQWNRCELGPYIGYLPQDVELFDGTISENIARFGAVDANKVVEAARRAGVHELILMQPEGYETEISSSSGVLSGGQRQRIGLARALYGRPRIIVLDEPNSNLDSNGELALIRALQLLKKEGTTLFIISHKKSFINCVDKLLVLRSGRLEAFGPRDDVFVYLAEKNIPSSRSDFSFYKKRTENNHG